MVARRAGVAVGLIILSVYAVRLARERPRQSAIVPGIALSERMEPPPVDEMPNAPPRVSVEPKTSPPSKDDDETLGDFLEELSDELGGSRMFATSGALRNEMFEPREDVIALLDELETIENAREVQLDQLQAEMSRMLEGYDPGWWDRNRREAEIDPVGRALVDTIVAYANRAEAVTAMYRNQRSSVLNSLDACVRRAMPPSAVERLARIIQEEQQPEATWCRSPW
ncbi:MAG: hypothetical protein HYY16_03365 [Planctomycetes bacterium]|nr:hypothetical protein [Planctomycetota bacterium]